MRHLRIILAILSFTSTAFAGITVSSPLDSTVSFPVTVAANSAGCYGRPSIAFGYSVDDQPVTHYGSASTLSLVDQSITPGAHVLHFKSWVGHGLGICPVVSVKIQVEPLIPTRAISSGILTGATDWKYEFDEGTSGTAVPTLTYPVSSPSLSGHAAQHTVTFTSNGGARYSQPFGVDSASDHFAYDVWVYIATPTTVANLELDLNQVLPNGATNIYAIQCSHWSRTWEYTTAGSWHKGTIPCDPQSWKANTWHHVQLGSSRTGDNLTSYDWIILDGVYTPWGAQGPSSYQLGWKPIGDLVLNFQIDGLGSGTATVYEDLLTIYRW